MTEHDTESGKIVNIKVIVIFETFS
jgi:hypothetical protein